MAKILTSPVNSKFYSALDSSSLNTDKSLSTFEHELGGHATNGDPNAAASDTTIASASESIIDIEGSTRPVVKIPVLKPAPVCTSKDSVGDLPRENDSNNDLLSLSSSEQKGNSNDSNSVITKLNKNLPPLYPDGILNSSGGSRSHVASGTTGVITIDDDDDIVVTQVSYIINNNITILGL